MKKGEFSSKKNKNNRSNIVSSKTSNDVEALLKNALIASGNVTTLANKMRVNKNLIYRWMAGITPNTKNLLSLLAITNPKNINNSNAELI